MTGVFSVIKGLVIKQVAGKQVTSTRIVRTLADKANPDSSSKLVVVQGTENEEKVRVRRARPSDGPRILRFVREQAHVTFPCTKAPNATMQLVLGDYVNRALAQGHSMLAEQQDSKRCWSSIRALAVGAALCPWDAQILERWARCISCPRARRFLQFTAHCLRSPALHNKYNVSNVLQVVLVVPPDMRKNSQLVRILAQNVVQRGQDTGFKLVRFDVTNAEIAKCLEELHQVNKEWQAAIDFLPNNRLDNEHRDKVKEKEGLESRTRSPSPVATTSNPQKEKQYVTVYSVLTQAKEK